MSLNMVCTVCEDVYDVTTVHVCPPMKDWPERRILAAIHDEQRVHTGLLTDLRGAIDDLAEVLRPKGDHDQIGSRCMRPNCMELHDPEPDTVTVTLPRDVARRAVSALYEAAECLRHAGNVVDAGRTGAAGVALADALDGEQS